LTASLQLWHGCRCPSVSQWAKHRSDLWAFDQKPSDGRSLPVAYSATGTVAHQPLTLSVALLSRGEPDPLPTPPRQRTTSSSGQSAFRRQRAPSACFRMVEKGAAPTSAIGTIHEHDRDLPSPVPARLKLPRDAPLRVAGPLSGLDQPSFLGSGIRHGFRRLNTLRARLLAPKLVTPTRVARTPSVASSWAAGWRGRPRRVCETHTCYELTRRACLRETRRRETCLRGISQQGRLQRSSAKRSALGCTQGAFHRGPLSWGMRTASGEPCTASLIPWRVGVIHRLFPACGDRAGASFTLPFDRASTKLDLAKARTLVACSARRRNINPGPQRPQRLLRSG